MIFVPLDDEEGDSDNDEESKEDGPQHDHDSDSEGDSSSDDNDSAAAAHAAAIGHSPQPITSKSSLSGKEIDPKSAESERNSDGPVEALEDGSVGPKGGSAPIAISPAGERPSHPMGNPESVSNGTIVESKIEQKQSVSKKDKKPRYYCPHNLNERDSDENTAIHVAILSRKLEHVKLLVEAGASVHKKSDGSPPIHAAISIGSISKHAQFAYDCVVFLNENGADLTAKDEAMHTPLYLACMYNIPKIVEFILSTEAGVSTLNVRSDRSQGRALHAAAKFDTASVVKATLTPRAPQLHHHPDGTLPKAHHPIPGFPVKLEPAPSIGKKGPSAVTAVSSGRHALVTQILLKTPGIEVDAMNSIGQTPLHVACARGNWPAIRLFLDAGANVELADRRGYTPGQVAHKRGMLIPNDLLDTLGGPPSSGIVAPPRDLIVDPDSSTLLVTHELCGLHRTCSPIRRDPHADPPPENVRRLSVLVDKETGILRTGEFSPCAWENETRRAAMVDILKVRPMQNLYCMLHTEFMTNSCFTSSAMNTTM